jgi:DNA-binding PadR family transcriptional regulator
VPTNGLDPRLEAELRRGVLQLVTLTLLETPRYGYDLVRLLSRSGFEVEEGTLYPILRRLEQQGTLSSAWDTNGVRPRKYYALSDSGRVLRDEMADGWRRVRDATDATLERRT